MTNEFLDKDGKIDLKFDNDKNMPLSTEEMNRAIKHKWIHPAFRQGTTSVDTLLDYVDVILDWYVPSVHAIDFMNFMRLVLGEEPENANPKAHYFLIDCIFRQESVIPYFQVRNVDFELLDDRILVLATREFSKSVLISVMLILYIAAKGELPGFGPVKFMLYVSDSMRNGVKTTMETIGSVYQESQYLKMIFEEATTNQDEISFVRKPTTKREIALYEEFVVKQGKKPSDVPGRMKRTFSMKGLGASSGGRGSRDNLSRPDGVLYDDMIGNATDAYSKIILDNIESTIEKDTLPALSGNGNFAILIGTPYNKNDPVYKRVEDESWAPIVFPKAERMDETVTEKTFRGVWADRHSYKQCKKDYMKAKKAYDNGNAIPMRGLMQEYYLRISNDEDRMVPDSMLRWFDASAIIERASEYNWYLTTDYTSTGSKGSDYSGAALWAVSHNGNWFLMDLVLRKMELQEQYDKTFELIEGVLDRVRWVEAGIEIDGQQNIHIYSLEKQMTERNTYFAFARQKGASRTQKGIRSRLEKGNKHWRFRSMLPMFQQGKIWFANELRESPDMKEMLEEIRYVSYSGIGSSSDDGLDLISMVGMLEISLPSKEFSGSSEPAKKRVGMKRNRVNAKIWGRGAGEESTGTAYDSYNG